LFSNVYTCHVLCQPCRKHGRGALSFADGTLYEGAFVDNAIEGVGTMTFAAGTALQEVN
jgi:hypothetical protein